MQLLAQEVGGPFLQKLEGWVRNEGGALEFETLLNGFVRVQRFDRSGRRVQIGERFVLARALQVALSPSQNQSAFSRERRRQVDLLPEFLDRNIPGRLTRWLDLGGHMRVTSVRDRIRVTLYRNGHSQEGVRALIDARIPGFLRNLVRVSHTVEERAFTHSTMLRRLESDEIRREGEGATFVEALRNALGIQVQSIQRYASEAHLTSAIRQAVDVYVRNRELESLFGDGEQGMYALYSETERAVLERAEGELSLLAEALAQAATHLHSESPVYDAWVYGENGFRTHRHLRGQDEIIMIVQSETQFQWSLKREVGTQNYVHIHADHSLETLLKALQSEAL